MPNFTPKSDFAAVDAHAVQSHEYDELPALTSNMLARAKVRKSGSIEQYRTSMNIENIEALRTLYPPAKERAVKKQLAHLDHHCRQFIAISPFVVLSSSSAAWTMDASPRGGAPGFVRTLDEHTLLIPDAPGNNRLDTLENIIATRQLGLLFLIPGVDEALRVNGTALLSSDEENLKHFADERRPPKLVIKVSVKEAYLHCAKALMRSSLWDAERHLDRTALPTMGQMLKDQIDGDAPAETQEEMVRRYKADL